MGIRLSTAARNAAVNGVVDLIDAGAGAGTLKIYDGTQPATGDTDPSTQTLLATVAFPDPAFGNAASGTAGPVDPAAVTGVAAGTAAWFLVEDSTGANIMSGTVTATGGGGDLQLATTTISVGVNVDVTSFSVTIPAS